MGEPNKTVSGIVTVCTYVSAKSGTVLVRFQTKEDAAGFAVGRQGFESSGQKTTDVSGLGDQAFSSTLGGGTIAVTTVVARKGEVEVLVTSRAPVDKETALITTIFAAL
jgi:hypothetical protein